LNNILSYSVRGSPSLLAVGGLIFDYVEAPICADGTDEFYDDLAAATG